MLVHLQKQMIILNQCSRRSIFCRLLSYKVCQFWVLVLKAFCLYVQMAICWEGCWRVFGLSQHHNYILMELCSPTTLTRHFSLRLKQYLLFLQVTNDLQLIQLLMSFLSLKDLLRFLALSSHFASYKRLQSVQLRILRAKLAHYEKPEQPLRWDPILHLLPIISEPLNPKTRRIEEDHKNLMFKQGIRLVKDTKRKALINKLKLDNTKPNKLQEEYLKEQQRLQEQLKGNQTQGWGKVTHDEYYFKQYRDLYNKDKPQEKQHPMTVKKSSVRPKPKTSSLDLIEHQHARMDYERRKARKLQMKQEFIPKEQLKKLAQRDPCTREVYNRIYEQEEKIKIQQANVAKLRMAPLPDPSLFALEPAEVKVMKQSIAGKMFSGIKSLLAIDQH